MVGWLVGSEVCRYEYAVSITYGWGGAERGKKRRNASRSRARSRGGVSETVVKGFCCFSCRCEIGLDWIGYLRIEGARDSRSRVGSLRRENIKESMSVCVRSGEREEVRVIES